MLRNARTATNGYPGVPDAADRHYPKIVEAMTALGLRRHLRLLGIIELAFVTPFVGPATIKLGFILASCSFGGAIATERSHDASKANPSIPLVLRWIGAFVRDRP